MPVANVPDYRAEIADLIEAWGLNPNTIIRSSATVHGYETFVLDENGKSVFVNDTFETEEHEWPEGFPVEALFYMLWQMDRAWK